MTGSANRTSPRRRNQRIAHRTRAVLVALLALALLSVLATPVGAQAVTQTSTPTIPTDNDVGAEFLILNERTGRLLDVDDGRGAVDHVDLSIAAAEDDRWRLVEGSSGLKIVNVSSGGRLAERSNGEVVTDASNVGVAGDTWALTLRPDGTYVITNTESGRSLDTDSRNGRFTVDTTRNISDSNDDAHWRLVLLDPDLDRLDGATVMFSNIATSRWLDVDRGTVEGANVDQSIVSSTDDRWVLERLANGNWLIRNDETGGWLRADSSSPYNASTVLDRADADEWSIQRDARNVWTIVHVPSGRGLDADGRSARYNVDTSSNLPDEDAQWLIGAFTPLPEQPVEVELILDAPDTVQVGESDPFIITITNTGGVDLVDSPDSDLTLTVAGLHVSDEVVDDIPAIAVGESIELEVSLTGLAEGTRDVTATFSITIDGEREVLASDAASVDVTDPTPGVVELEIDASGDAFVGVPTTLFADIFNNTDVPVLENAELFVLLSGDNLIADRVGPIPTIGSISRTSVPIEATFQVAGPTLVTAELIGVALDGSDSIVLATGTTTVSVTDDQPDDLRASASFVCVENSAQARVVLVNGSATAATFVITGDDFNPDSVTVDPDSQQTLLLVPNAPVDGDYPIRVRVGGDTILDTTLTIVCEGAGRPIIRSLSPGADSPADAPEFARPGSLLTADAIGLFGNTLSFDHELTTLGGLVVDAATSIGATWTPSIPAGYPDQVLAWTVTVTDERGGVARTTVYLDAATGAPALPPCQVGVTSVQITSHADNEVVDTGAAGTGTGSFILAGTATNADEVLITIEDETFPAALAATGDACVRTWSVEIYGYKAGVFSFVATSGAATADVALDIVPPSDIDVLFTPDYAATSALALDLVSFDDQSGEMIFNGSLSDLEVGQVIVGQPIPGIAPEGYLRVIDAISFQNGTTVLATHQALLVDVFRQVDDTMAAGGAANQAGAQLQQLDRIIDDTSTSVDGSATLLFQASLDTEIMGELDIDWSVECWAIFCAPIPSVELFLIEGKLIGEAGVGLTASAEASVEIEFQDIIDIPGPALVIGIVPITSALEIEPFAQATVNGEAELRIDVEATIGAGYEYKGDGTGRGAYKIMEFDGPDLDAELGLGLRVDAGFNVELEILLADAIGPTVNAKPAFTAKAELTVNPDEQFIEWAYGVSLLELGLGGNVEVPVIGFELVDIETNFLDDGIFFALDSGRIDIGGDVLCNIGGDGGGLIEIEQIDPNCPLAQQIFDRLRGLSDGGDQLGPMSRRGGVRSQNDLLSVAVTCIETAGSFERAEEFCLNGTVLYSGQGIQAEQTTHIAEAQGMGFPTSLTFETAGESRNGWYYNSQPQNRCGANNNEATDFYVNRLGGASDVKVQCDEYPFFSTTSGFRRAGNRPTPSTKPISASSNTSAGADLGTFSRQCPTVRGTNGAAVQPFLIVPTRNANVETRSFWTCGNIDPDAIGQADGDFVDESPVLTATPAGGDITEATVLRIGVADTQSGFNEISVEWVLRIDTPGGNGPIIAESEAGLLVQPNSSVTLPALSAVDVNNPLLLEARATDPDGNTGVGVWTYNDGREIGGASDVSYVFTDFDDEVRVGDLVTYTVEITNEGPTPVPANDILIPGLIVTSSVPVESISTSQVAAPIPVGDSTTVTVSVTFAGDGTATLDHVLRASGPDGVSVTYPSTTPSPTVTVLPADAEAQATIVATSPGDAVVGTPVTYTVDITNLGPGPIGDNDALVTALGVTSSLLVDDIQVTLPLPILEGEPPTEATVEVTFAVAGTATIEHRLTTSDPLINIVHGEADPITIDVQPDTDATIAVDVPDTVTAGEEFDVIVTITNTSASELLDGDPVDLYLDVTAGAAPAVRAGAIPTVAPGGNADVIVTITAPALPQELDLTIELFADPFEFAPSLIDGADATVTVVEALQPDPEVSIVGPPTANPGELITYTVTITNNGEGDLVDLDNGIDLFLTLTGGLNGSEGDIGTIPAGLSETYEFTGLAPTDLGPVTVTATLNAAPIGDIPVVVDTASTTLTVQPGPQPDPVVSIAGPGTALPGESVTYTVTITNNGDGDLVDLDNGIDLFLTLTGIPGNEGAIGTVPAGQARDFTITGTAPNAPGAITVTATLNAAPIGDIPVAIDTASTTLTIDTPPQPNASITLSGPGTAEPGNPITYTVTITNSGDGDLVDGANGVGLFITLSGGVTGTENNIGTVAAGTSRTYTITGTSPAAGNYTLTANLTAAPNNGDPAAIIDTDTLTLNVTNPPPPPQADPVVSITGPSSAQPGDAISYAVTVTNAGDGNLVDGANGVDLFITLSGVPGSVAAIGIIAPGNSVIFNISTTAPTNPGAVTVTANLTAAPNNGDPAVVVDSDSLTLTVTNPPPPPQPNASITLNGPGTAEPGNPITYTVTITNSGDGDLVDGANGVGLFITLSGGVTGTENNIGTVAAGTSRTYTITGTSPAAGNYTLTANLTAAPNNGDPAAIIDTDTLTLNVTNPPPPPQPNASITVTGPGLAEPGDSLTYTVTITNSGDGDLVDGANGVDLFITLSGGVSGNDPNVGVVPAGTSRSYSIFAIAPSVGNYTVTATLTAAPSNGDPAATVDSDTAFLTVTNPPQPNASITLNGPGTAEPGNPITYTVTITNSGDGDLVDGANGVDLFISLFGGVTGTENNIGVVAAGTSRNYTITGTSPAAGNYTLTANLTAAPNNGDPSAIIDTDTLTLNVTNPPPPPQPDMSLLILGPTEVFVSTDVTYTVRLVNNGAGTFRDPDGVVDLQVVAQSSPSGRTVAVGNLPDVPPNSTRDVTVQVRWDITTNSGRFVAELQALGELGASVVADAGITVRVVDVLGGPFQ